MVRASERQAQISAYLEERGYASLKDLVGRFGVSVTTIRRDLSEMEGRGTAKRTHGGAFHLDAPDHPLDYARRRAQNVAEKRAIGQLAASLIQDGEAVLLDGGTTAYQVAEHLRDRRLQVVTNSLPVATLLGKSSETEVVFLGGSIMPRTGVALGRYAENMLRALHVRWAVMGTAGITEEGLFNANLLMVEVEHLMIDAADETIVVVDHSKFGRRSLVHLCDFEQLNHLVTDSGVAGNWVELVESRGAEVHLADVGGGQGEVGFEPGRGGTNERDMGNRR